MIKRILALDGVIAVCQFRDDGVLVEGYGMPDEQQLVGLAMFAHNYKRMVQGNADQLAMFTRMNGWTPPGGWVVSGPELSVCSVGNVVCVLDNRHSEINQVMQELQETSRW